MTRQEAKQRIEKLRQLINHHRYLYHVLDRQEISDAALDSLKKELFDLENLFPEFITPDSPTQRVGGRPLEKFEKVKHSKPMLSFNDAFSQSDMKDWLERVSKLLTKEEIAQLNFYCELKIDGLAIELIYEKEIFKAGSTRGDGLIGENVTQNLKTVEAIPLKIRTENSSLLANRELFSGELVVRGEVFISKKEFKKINKEQEKAGLPVYANPRNLAAGSIRQLDPKITIARRLDSFAYELLTGFGQEISRSPRATGMAAESLATHEEKHKILKSFGFKTNPHNRYCKNLAEVFEFHNYCQKIREKLPYEIDGIVVIINSNKIFEKLGVVGKAPRGAMAYKFPVKQGTTIIEDIKVQVGRTGVLTPVAYLKPVQIGGTTISRATLHNEDEIKRLGVRIGDTVIVGRAGDVIPDVIKVLPELRTGREKEFKIPKICPSCGSKVLKPKSEVMHRCSNSNCFAMQRQNFYHFVSKKAFDVRGLGPKIIDRLLEEGLISDPADLFELEDGDILPLERFAEKSAENLIKAVQKSKEISLHKFIYALGIRNVGEETAEDLADYFRSLEKLKKAGPENLQKIRDIGPIVARSIFNWFSQKRNINLLDKLIKNGVRIKTQPLGLNKGKLKGLNFVLTGTLKTLTREELKEKIRELGGDVSESVSKNIDFVVAGDEPGSKLKKAEKLDVKIIDEKQLLFLLKK